MQLSAIRRVVVFVVPLEILASLGLLLVRRLGLLDLALGLFLLELCLVDVAADNVLRASACTSRFKHLRTSSSSSSRSSSSSSSRDALITD
jgi:hypothetical protein